MEDLPPKLPKMITVSQRCYGDASSADEWSLHACADIAGHLDDIGDKVIVGTYELIGLQEVSAVVETKKIKG